ncbi:MAG: hypothetical protein RLY87_1846 [Chloroflexota bacterium]
MTRRLIVLLLSVCCASMIAACGTPTADTPTPTMDMSSHMLHATADPATLALPYDVLFIDGMMMHHLAAIDMANAALQSATNPDIKALATQIVTTQSAEVTQLRDWRATWYPNAPMTAGTGAHMGTMQVSTDEAIPYDVRWITAMIDHHKGAVTMAQEALTKAEHAELKTLSTAIIEAQNTEIAQMEAWLPK